ncbi:MAG: hypothetical protein Q9M30_05180 [Mariprofundaceae bacterium]|nr:hypothetical protein [Mariprofundaceae bacterium]
MKQALLSLFFYSRAIHGNSKEEIPCFHHPLHLQIQNNSGEGVTMSVGKNMGFLCKNRYLDLGITVGCVAITAYSIMTDTEELIAFAIPAGLGIFRQFAPLLSFPFVVSLGIATILTLDWAGLIPFDIGFS